MRYSLSNYVLFKIIIWIILYCWIQQGVSSCVHRVNVALLIRRKIIAIWNIKLTTQSDKFYIIRFRTTKLNKNQNNSR